MMSPCVVMRGARHVMVVCGPVVPKTAWPGWGPRGALPGWGGLPTASGRPEGISYGSHPPGLAAGWSYTHGPRFALPVPAGSRPPPLPCLLLPDRRHPHPYRPSVRASAERDRDHLGGGLVRRVDPQPGRRDRPAEGAGVPDIELSGRGGPVGEPDHARLHAAPARRAA